MSISWRPKTGWNNPYKHSESVQAWDVPGAYSDVEDEEYDAYEAGANTMLEAVIKWIKQNSKTETWENKYGDELDVIIIEECIFNQLIKEV